MATGRATRPLLPLMGDTLYAFSKMFSTPLMSLHTAKAVGILSGERPQSISVSGNPQA
jgi:hypothetical protein